MVERTTFATVPLRGLVILYVPGEPSRCPQCAGKHWLVGRSTAECSDCGWAAEITCSADDALEVAAS